MKSNIFLTLFQINKYLNISFKLTKIKAENFKDIFHFHSGRKFKLIDLMTEETFINSQGQCENKTFPIQFNPEPEQKTKKQNMDFDDYISTNTFEQQNKRTAEM